jgi:hypothetical protein
MALSTHFRHGRTCSGHPRRSAPPALMLRHPVDGRVKPGHDELGVGRSPLWTHESLNTDKHGCRYAATDGHG